MTDHISNAVSPELDELRRVAWAEWDYQIPQTVADVVALLERRIAVHEHWRDWLATEPDEAGDAKRLGGGTVESHEHYNAQYRGAIAVVLALLDQLERARGALERIAEFRPKTQGEQDHDSPYVQIATFAKRTAREALSKEPPK